MGLRSLLGVVVGAESGADITAFLGPFGAFSIVVIIGVVVVRHLNTENTKLKADKDKLLEIILPLIPEVRDVMKTAVAALERNTSALGDAEQAIGRSLTELESARLRELLTTLASNQQQRGGSQETR